MGHSHAPGTSSTHADPPGGHGMAVLGSDAIFLSHLPMFMSPHHYQVILRASFGPVDAPFREDRKAHPEAKLYTFAPAPFVLPELFPTADGRPPKRTSFTGQLVRNHFEQPPAHPEPPVLVASDVTVHVTGVVHQHRLLPPAPRPASLQCLLFGNGGERFVAHLISHPPDYDQLVAVEVRGHDFSDDELAHGVPMTIAGRADAAKDRIKEGDTVSATAHVGGADVAIDVLARQDVYFETADLRESM